MNSFILEKKIYDKPDNGCPICFEELKNDDYLPCGHWSHLSCLFKWGQNICPVCKKSFDDDLFSKFEDEEHSDEEYSDEEHSDEEHSDVPLSYLINLVNQEFEQYIGSYMSRQNSTNQNNNVIIPTNQNNRVNTYRVSTSRNYRWRR